MVGVSLLSTNLIDGDIRAQHSERASSRKPRETSDEKPIGDQAAA